MPVKDILTVAWKEWREFLWLGGSVRGGRFGLLLMVALFGILLPYETGADWLTSPAPMFYWAWVPLMLVGGAVADSFAGERERHTLETLLASRLPDQAIVLGKVLAAVGYGWGLVMVMLALSIVTVNLSVAQPGIVLPPWPLGVVAPLVALLVSGVTAVAGILVSVRASTVRQAAQTLNVGVLVLVFTPMVVSQLLPDAWRTQLAASLLSVGTSTVVWAGVAALGLVDAILLGIALRRFRRVRLILD
jgi:ABC-2 type transport system permease protein